MMKLRRDGREALDRLPIGYAREDETAFSPRDSVGGRSASLCAIHAARWDSGPGPPRPRGAKGRNRQDIILGQPPIPKAKTAKLACPFPFPSPSAGAADSVRAAVDARLAKHGFHARRGCRILQPPLCRFAFRPPEGQGQPKKRQSRATTLVGRRTRLGRLGNQSCMYLASTERAAECK